MATKGQIIPLAEKFERAVVRGAGCWDWRLSKIKGYGALSHQYKSLRAHRVSYELFVGPIPEGMCVMHRCDNPACSNPDHLMLGTQVENVADKISKGRQAKGYATGSHTMPHRRARGERHGKSKLTDGEVSLLREMGAAGWKHESIAKIVGISRSGVGKILSGAYR